MANDLEAGIPDRSVSHPAHDILSDSDWEGLAARRPRPRANTDDSQWKQGDPAPEISELAAPVAIAFGSASSQEDCSRKETEAAHAFQSDAIRTDISSWEAKFRSRMQHRWARFLGDHPRACRTFLWLRGPRPQVTETEVQPFLPRVERFFDRFFTPVYRARHLVVPLFLVAWLMAFIFLVRASYFDSSTSAGAPTFINPDDSFWSKNAGCGINGTNCESSGSLLFRCPAQSLSVKLLDYYPVGTQEVIYKPLVVGGFDSNQTYRADSWICPSAIQHGLFGNHEGGCGRLLQVGRFTNFIGGKANGIESVSFDTEFISSYRFDDAVSAGDCADIRDQILGFNVAMTAVMSFVIRPTASVFYWVLFCVGFWHVVLVSDPTSTPPDPSLGFKYFLPALFIGYAFWRFSWRYVLPAYETATLERTVWYLGGFWVGLLINVSLSWIPIDRLTSHDIKQMPGGIVAVVVLAVFLLLVIVNQLRVIRRTGWLFFYLWWYIVGIVVIGLLFTLPYTFRLHHYFAAIILMPGCAFVTRPSALFQGFLLGMFLDGAGRWGFDSIFETAASLVGDGSLGSALPDFITNSTNFIAQQTSFAWSPIPSDLSDQWDSFGLMLDDVLVYAGTATNFSLAALDASLPHYLRLSYISQGSYGDFTKAATAFIANGTWVNPAAGPS